MLCYYKRPCCRFVKQLFSYYHHYEIYYMYKVLHDHWTAITIMRNTNRTPTNQLNYACVVKYYTLYQLTAWLYYLFLGWEWWSRTFRYIYNAIKKCCDIFFTCNNMPPLLARPERQKLLKYCRGRSLLSSPALLPYNLLWKMHSTGNLIFLYTLYTKPLLYRCN